MTDGQGKTHGHTTGIPSACTFPVSEKKSALSEGSQTLLTLSFIGRFPSPAGAQTSSQQYVYGSQPNSPSSVVFGFSKTAQTGALNLIPGFPIPERFEGGLVAIDGQGKFLFVLNAKSNSISMFQIDQASGTLSEVPASPFQVPPTINPNLAPSQPISIAAHRRSRLRHQRRLYQGCRSSSSLFN